MVGHNFIIKSVEKTNYPEIFRNDFFRKISLIIPLVSFEDKSLKKPQLRGSRLTQCCHY